MFKRIILFCLINALILMMVTVVFSVFGLERYITQYGLNYTSLAVYSMVAGFGGAFISLALSKFIAKWMMGVRVIEHAAPNSQEAWLLNRVAALSQAANLPKVPEVGIYEDEEVNAFATGATKRSSLVAVSRGMLQRMEASEVEAVLAHEVGHIANGDMVTMTLLQGVINTFAIFLSRIIAFAVSRLVREELGMLVFYIVSFVMQIVFAILGTMVVMAYSRRREFAADASAAHLTSKGSMIAALERLKSTQDLVDHSKPAMQTMRIAGGRKGFMKLFASHPDLDDRIAKLREA